MERREKTVEKSFTCKAYNSHAFHGSACARPAFRTNEPKTEIGSPPYLLRRATRCRSYRLTVAYVRAAIFYFSPSSCLSMSATRLHSVWQYVEHRWSSLCLRGRGIRQIGQSSPRRIECGSLMQISRNVFRRITLEVYSATLHLSIVSVGNVGIWQVASVIHPK